MRIVRNAMKSLAGAIIFVGGVSNAGLSSLEFTPTNVAFRIGVDQIPLLAFTFGHENGLLMEADGGTGYISCFDDRIDIFRLNLIIDTPSPEYFAQVSKVFIGLRDSNRIQFGAYKSARISDFDTPPDIFDLLKYESALFDVVRGYDAISIDRYKGLYLSTVIQADFFEALKSLNQMSVVYYSDEQIFTNMFYFDYELKQETSDEFVKACIGN